MEEVCFRMENTESFMKVVTDGMNSAVSDLKPERRNT
jgi:hypothetical protein